MKKIMMVIASLMMGATANAGDVSVRHVSFQKGPADWTANVTLEHADTGWKHYADAWRVVDMKGNVLGTRTLWHPHVDEQPFTRSLSGINIPAKITKVYVEAHDKVHGWSKDRVLVDLTKKKGKRFEVR